jgi:hypothetical protein
VTGPSTDRRPRRGRRCDGVDAHAVAAELGGGGEREADDSGLGRRVRRLADEAEQPRGRRRVHDLSVDGASRLGLVAPPPARGLGHEHRADHVDLEHRPPLVGRRAQQQSAAQDAGVVHDDVEPAPRVDGELHHGAGVVGVGDVAVRRHRLAARGADLGRHVVGRTGRRTGAVGLDAEVVHHHARSVGG